MLWMCSRLLSRSPENMWRFELDCSNKFWWILTFWPWVENQPAANNILWLLGPGGLDFMLGCVVSALRYKVTSCQLVMQGCFGKAAEQGRWFFKGTPSPIPGKLVPRSKGTPLRHRGKLQSFGRLPVRDHYEAKWWYLAVGHILWIYDNISFLRITYVVDARHAFYCIKLLLFEQKHIGS